MECKTSSNFRNKKRISELETDSEKKTLDLY
jgi:hypothetical protein